jgi:hypothetical protein
VARSQYAPTPPSTITEQRSSFAFRLPRELS